MYIDRSTFTNEIMANEYEYLMNLDLPVESEREQLLVLKIVAASESRIVLTKIIAEKKLFSQVSGKVWGEILAINPFLISFRLIDDYKYDEFAVLLNVHAISVIPNPSIHLILKAIRAEYSMAGCFRLMDIDTVDIILKAVPEATWHFKNISEEHKWNGSQYIFGAGNVISDHVLLDAAENGDLDDIELDSLSDETKLLLLKINTGLYSRMGNLSEEHLLCLASKGCRSFYKDGMSDSVKKELLSTNPSTAMGLIGPTGTSSMTREDVMIGAVKSLNFLEQYAEYLGNQDFLLELHSYIGDAIRPLKTVLPLSIQWHLIRTDISYIKNIHFPDREIIDYVFNKNYGWLFHCDWKIFDPSQLELLLSLSNRTRYFDVDENFPIQHALRYVDSGVSNLKILSCYKLSDPEVCKVVSEHNIQYLQYLK